MSADRAKEETADATPHERPSRCPACGGGDVRVFYEATGVPVNSVLLMAARDEALSYPRGDVRLGFCSGCGFISNVAFDSRLTQYSGRYEETQGFSGTFNVFSRRLADRLVERHELRGKRVLEIGCGKGEFLTLLCEGGRNEGVGFDPSYVEERRPAGADGVRFVADFYSEKYAGERADLVCCKMTLEHVSDAAGFVRMIRRTIGYEPGTVVFFQVPDAGRILEEGAFWDVYYEHCSYFTAGSLARLFARCGFCVEDVGVDYGGQYLMLEARPAEHEGETATSAGETPQETARLVERFATATERGRELWSERLSRWAQARKRVVLWGAGSKGVAFLATLGAADRVAFCIDVNPFKHGTYMPGTGHEISAPQRLLSDRPDVVVVMNPIYVDEIRRDLSALGLSPELVSV